MRRDDIQQHAIRVLVFSAMLIVAGSASAQRGKTRLSTSGKFVPKQIIIRMDQARAADLQRVKAAVGATGHQRLYRQNLWLLELATGSDVRKAEDTLERIEGVEYAHPNMIMRASGDPNDPDYPLQWGFDQPSDADIDAPEAWDIQTDGSEQIVAVIDSGVKYDHPDLQANMWVNEDEIPDNFIDDDGNDFVDDVYGYDFINGDGDPYDDYGHGTHCAGTVGADTNNGLGVAGVCWTAKIMSLKFLGSDSILDELFSPGCHHPVSGRASSEDGEQSSEAERCCRHGVGLVVKMGKTAQESRFNLLLS